MKYRPQSFSELVGSPFNFAVLEKLASGTVEVPTGFLFSGPSGTGKTSAARLLASGICNDVMEIDAATSRGIDSVREIISSLRYSSSDKYRVVIFDEAHNLTTPAFDALLKTLEEPPSGVVFILITTSAHLIPETVKTRLFEFEFPPVLLDSIASRLRAVAGLEGYNITPDLVTEIASQSAGSVRTALMLLEKASLAGVSTRDELAAITGTHDVALPLATSLVYQEYGDVRKSLEAALSITADPQVVVSSLVRLLSDLLVVRSGSLPQESIGLEQRVALAWRLSHDQIIEALRLLWDIRTRLPNSSSAHADLELVVVLLHEVLRLAENLRTAEPVAVHSAEEEDEVLQLADLQRS